MINTHNMHMNRTRANARIEDLLRVHIEALRGDPSTARVAEALHNATPDFHALIGEIFDELDAMIEQERLNEQEARQAADDAA